MENLRHLTRESLQSLRWRAAIARRAGKQDLRNILAYGRNAPLKHQLIWVDPTTIRLLLREPDRSALRYRSGQVLAGDWDLNTRPVESAKMRFCLQHWCDGVSWEETGAYDNLMRAIREAGGSYDGCSTLEDVVERYARLDATFSQVRRERRLRTRRQLGRQVFRERGGIGIHIVRDGEPIWGFDGSHRLAIAQALKLPIIPAQLGVVHAEAFPEWRRYSPPRTTIGLERI